MFHVCGVFAETQTRNTTGFENFDTKNEFEQLLINFTNESLQDAFNKQVFNNELRLYKEEGIEVTVSSCPDNTQCLLLLSERPKGIIPRFATRARAFSLFFHPLLPGRKVSCVSRPTSLCGEARMYLPCCHGGGNVVVVVGRSCC